MSARTLDGTGATGASTDPDGFCNNCNQVLAPETAEVTLDHDVLTVVGVAGVLRCAEDTVRRIPRDELPVYRAGKRNLYLRDDLLRYVRSRRVGQSAADLARRDVVDDVLGLRTDDARVRSRRRTS